MKKLKTYDTFVNESIRDRMTPKSKEEIETIMTKMKEGGEVRTYTELIGKTIVDVKENEDRYGFVVSVDFVFDDGSVYSMYNEEAGTGNDCTITLEDVNGEWSDLYGEPLVVAEEITNTTQSGSGTWTFYKFATIKGYVDLRWFGESNGYYSEIVSFRKIK
jgi:hypothetical protein